jgi:transposase-like protein
VVHGGTKRHPEELRTLAIRRFRSCQNAAQLAREIGIPRQTLYRWTDESESERVEAHEDGRLVPVESSKSISRVVCSLKRRRQVPDLLDRPRVERTYSSDSETHFGAPHPGMLRSRPVA